MSTTIHHHRFRVRTALRAVAWLCPPRLSTTYPFLPALPNPAFSTSRPHITPLRDAVKAPVDGPASPDSPPSNGLVEPDRGRRGTPRTRAIASGRRLPATRPARRPGSRRRPTASPLHARGPWASLATMCASPAATRRDPVLREPAEPAVDRGGRHLNDRPTPYERYEQ